MERVVYRIVAGPRPTVDDFRSNREKGLPPRGPEITDQSLWVGWSVFDDRTAAEQRARRYNLGTHLAVLRLPASWADNPARMQKTLGPHHYTVWGTYIEIEPFIQDVIAVRAE